MGAGTLSTGINGSTADVSLVNQYKSALSEDLVPRNSSGVATHEAGDLGTSSIEWKRAHIIAGYWSIGDIKPHHSYDGIIGAGQGWMLCDGSIINEANYEAQTGVSVGDWDKYIISSVLDGKYAPNLADKYLVGADTTTEDGTAAIATVGSEDNEIDLSHSHSHSHSHNHQWYNDNLSETDQTYNSGGAATFIGGGTTDIKNKLYPSQASVGSLSDSYTNNDATVDATNALSSTQSIQPHSIEVQYYIRII